jgi:hypothetical protein
MEDQQIPLQLELVILRYIHAKALLSADKGALQACAHHSCFCLGNRDGLCYTKRQQKRVIIKWYYMAPSQGIPMENPGVEGIYTYKIT